MTPSAAVLTRRRLWYAAVSLLLLLPCYWQPRLQGGDLAGHLYNGWLTREVESGRTDGLLIVHPTTDILFDAILGALHPLLGPEAGQRVAVSLVVLVFVWGAYAFVAAVSGRGCRQVLPCLAILAYGWVFHMGFFDFYLSLGLCFWAMALAWDMALRRLFFAAAFLVLAYLAHALPVIWCCSLLTYVYMARRMSAFRRSCLTAGVIAIQMFCHVLAGLIMTVRTAPAQSVAPGGLDHVWTYGPKYYWVLVALTAVWALWFLKLVRERGARLVVAGIPFHLCVISAAAVFILPGTVLVPGVFHAIGFIGERMSVGVAVCVCALLATVRPRKLEQWALALVVLTFFGFLYSDERAWNSREDQRQYLMSDIRASSPDVRLR